MEAMFADLKNRLAEIDDLDNAGAVLEWDVRTMMPPRGGPARAEQLATLASIRHKKFTSPDIARLLESLRSYESGLPFDSDEASLIRVARRDFEKQSKIPAELEAEMTRAAAMGREAWVEALRKSDFSLFLPHLQKHIELKLRYIECFHPAGDVYDVLLDDYERDLKTAEVRSVFDSLKKDLVPLISSVNARSGVVDDECLYGHFPEGRQRDFCVAVISSFGFNPDSWRFDPTVHPFTISFSTDDVRITTRYHEDFISAALFGSMHECGHGLNSAGVAASLERTPLNGHVSYAWGESQSRTWENLVGRSRPFWRYFYPQLQSAFPEQFKSVAVETFYRALNRVRPSLIRVEADEATYGLHIIIRFELEQDMIHGRIKLKELPEAWNAKMKAYLGVVVPDDARGILQDTHWSQGSFGYFPTYLLGNIIASQIWEKVLVDIPDLYGQFERGEFQPLRMWLTEHIYKYGRKFTPAEMRDKVLGGPLDVGPFVRYLKAKFSEIYGL